VKNLTGVAAPLGYGERFRAAEWGNALAASAARAEHAVVTALEFPPCFRESGDEHANRDRLRDH